MKNPALLLQSCRSSKTIRSFSFLDFARCSFIGASFHIFAFSRNRLFVYSLPRVQDLWMPHSQTQEYTPFIHPFVNTISHSFINYVLVTQNVPGSNLGSAYKK